MAGTGAGERFVDIRKAAQEAEVSPRTVRRWLDEGKLSKYRRAIDSRVLIAWSELSFVCQPVPDDDNRA